MPMVKLALIAVLCNVAPILLAAEPNADGVACAASPTEVPAGQHVMLQMLSSSTQKLLENRSSSDVSLIREQRGPVSPDSRFDYVGRGQCLTADNEKKDLGWSTCGTGKMGGCPDLLECMTRCAESPSCGALDWHAGYCWIFKALPKPYVKGNGYLRWYDCYAKIPTTTTTTTTTEAPKCGGTLDFSGKLIRDNVVGTIVTASDFTLEFSLTPRSGWRTDWQSILHMTEDARPANCCGPNNRMPAILFKKNEATKISLAMSNPMNSNDMLDADKVLQTDREYSFKFTVSGTNAEIFIDGQSVGRKQLSSRPNGGVKARVYLGDPWYQVGDAEIKNVKYTNIGGPAACPSL